VKQVLPTSLDVDKRGVDKRVSAREVALQVVRDVFPTKPQTERDAQEAFDYRLRKAELDPRDRAFATELAYGSIKLRRTLDWYLQPFIGERPQPVDPAVAEILRLAIYEIVYTQADEHATVFEFVNLAKKYGHRGVAGLVNAVLRSFLRDKPVPPSRESFADEDEYLGVAYSLPNWIVRMLRRVFPTELETICRGVNDPAQAPSESAAMPVPILNPQPGEAVLDVASGRGNKALQTGALLAGEGTLVCIEKNPRKAAILERRLSEAGVPAAIIIGDATEELLKPDQQFDRVLLDAPCSGIGVIGRHPEARWRKREDDGARLGHLQTALLKRSAQHVHKGGVLVYAVCSINPRETVEVVDTFLRTHSYSRGLIPAAFEPFVTAEGDVLVPPGIEGRDGFYIARLERHT
jgi:16S rRNA (cytosine967-C5)-methyltransferase